MTLWERLRSETVGVIRSIGYDARRRIGRGRDDAYPEYDAYARRPRRALLSGGIMVLAASGVAGTYFVLSGGLGGWLLDTDPAAQTPAVRPETSTIATAASAPRSRPSATTSARPVPSGIGLPPIVIPGGHIATGSTPTPSPSNHATSAPSTSATPTPISTPPPPAPSPSLSPTPTDNPSSDPPNPPISPAPTDTGTAADIAYAPAHDSAAQPVDIRSVSTFVPAGA
jgi:hypothetical protein